MIITCYEAFFEVHNQLESLGYQFEKDFIGAGALVLGCGEQVDEECDSIWAWRKISTISEMGR